MLHATPTYCIFWKRAPNRQRDSSITTGMAKQSNSMTDVIEV